MQNLATDAGYDPIALATATEKVVVDGNRRKYVQLGRPLRFYGGTTSATEVGCNLRCKFCFSDKPVWKPKATGKFYTPQQVFDGLVKKKAFEISFPIQISIILKILKILPNKIYLYLMKKLTKFQKR